MSLDDKQVVCLERDSRGCPSKVAVLDSRDVQEISAAMMLNLANVRTLAAPYKKD